MNSKKAEHPGCSAFATYGDKKGKEVKDKKKKSKKQCKVKY